MFVWSRRKDIFIVHRNRRFRLKKTRISCFCHIPIKSSCGHALWSGTVLLVQRCWTYSSSVKNFHNYCYKITTRSKGAATQTLIFIGSLWCVLFQQYDYTYVLAFPASTGLSRRGKNASFLPPRERRPLLAGKMFFCRISTDILLKMFQYSSCQIFEQLKLEVFIVNASPWYDILQVKSEILIFSMLHLGIQIFCIQNQVLNFEYFDMQNIQLSIVLPVKSLSFMIACQISNCDIWHANLEISESWNIPYEKILEFWELACSSLYSIFVMPNINLEIKIFWLQNLQILKIVPKASPKISKL